MHIGRQCRKLSEDRPERHATVEFTGEFGSRRTEFGMVALEGDGKCGSGVPLVAYDDSPQGRRLDGDILRLLVDGLVDRRGGSGLVLGGQPFGAQQDGMPAMTFQAVGDLPRLQSTQRIRTADMPQGVQRRLGNHRVRVVGQRGEQRHSLPVAPRTECLNHTRLQAAVDLA